MDAISTSSYGPRVLSHIPAITLFEPFDLNRSLPASPYTLIKTDDLRSIYTEIGRIQVYLRALLHDGAAVLQPPQADFQQVKPAAVHRIPSEILSLIFKHLIPPDDEGDHIHIPKITQFLLPAQICRAWREAAISTPSLWSSLTFNLDPPRTRKTMEMATTFLARAKDGPLSIKLGGGGVKQRSHPIIAVLLAHAHQWYNLALTFEISHLVYAKLLGPAGLLPRLYRLEVDYSIRQSDTIRETFPASPALRIAHLCKIITVGWYRTGNFPLLPWRQLQRLSFQGSLGDCLETLRLSPNLRVFEANMMNSPPLDQWNPVHHASLHELSIETDHNHTMLEALTLPALVSLSYSCERVLPTEDVFVSLLARSGIANTLEAFSLTFAAHTDASDIKSDRKSISSLSIVLHYLQHIPNLSQLYLCDLSRGRYADRGTVFPEITIASACRWLCWRSLDELNENYEQAYPFGDMLPKLKRFAITGPHTMSCIWVAEMVMTRWRDVDKTASPGRRNPAGRPARLESVEVNYKEACDHAKSSLSPAHNHTPAGQRALARLRLYRSEGLRVVGNIVDEVECIECVDEEIALYGLQPDFDSA